MTDDASTLITNMNSTENTDRKTAHMHWSQVLLIVLLTIVITIAGTYWVLKTYIFATAFTPVVLNTEEEKTLEAKLHAIGYEVGLSSQTTNITNQKKNGEIDESGFLKPEPYSEENAPRAISFTERELNALLAKNTDLAQKLAIDLTNDLVSAKLLIPLEEDFPVLGGKTLRFNAGIGITYQHDKPVIILKGVSIMGVPIPNAWLGGIKNIDLVSEFGVDPGFWQSFSEGIEDIHVTEGQINIKLKE
ncbi:arginine N-succinyltransferase [Nitrosomonas sp. Is37]|uniref:arginine N-succinyltransferase n=1 Tax=Nitrosomonas sp. Is37 TaxID=3080535 RepID=UPI00294B92D3|nr:arginine N-succinyltransferase [Nitrosomonas sp. Is37]